MDKPGMPWSLIGVSDEARKIIRVAAAENNQTIGQRNSDIADAAGLRSGHCRRACRQQTTEAIRNYQRELGLPVNRQPSEDLLRHLRQIAGVR